MRTVKKGKEPRGHVPWVLEGNPDCYQVVIMRATREQKSKKKKMSVIKIKKNKEKRSH